MDNPKFNEQKGHLEARCPFCGDSKTNKKAKCLSLDYYSPYDTYVFKCYRCEKTGNIVNLYSFLKGCSYREANLYLQDKKYDPEYLKNTILGNKFISKRESVEIDQDLDIDLSKDCYSITDEPMSKIGQKAIEKLKEFKENRKIPDDLPLYIAHSGRYKSRIIIPIYIGSKLVYFQGRSIYDEITPKYLNPRVEKKEIVLNIDKFDFNKYIIVNEGIIDAYMVGKQGTCVIGGYLDWDYIEKMKRQTKEGIIVCLDNPRTDKNAIKVLKKLLFYGINKFKSNLYFFVMPKEFEAKDLNELVVKYDINNVYEFVVENKKSMLHMKRFLLG